MVRVYLANGPGQAWPAWLEPIMDRTNLIGLQTDKQCVVLCPFMGQSLIKHGLTSFKWVVSGMLYCATVSGVLRPTL
jgi:hypothetical protein